MSKVLKVRWKRVKEWRWKCPRCGRVILGASEGFCLLLADRHDTWHRNNDMRGEAYTRRRELLVEAAAK